MIRTLSISLLAAAFSWANPLFDGADPHAMRIGKDYWIFPTEAHSPTGSIFAAYRSTDLGHWKREGVILDINDVPWVKANGAPRNIAWAPAMAEKDGRFYFYYSIGPQTETHPSRIGVAAADAPTGPFKDSGAPLLTGGNGFEAIDPMVFHDPASGKDLLYAGGSAGSTLKVFELSADMLRLAREVPVANPRHFTEGAFMHLREGIYYLSYSHGRWNDASYSVHYCTAPSATGPWTYRGAILESDGARQGPGHHAFVEDPATGKWSIIYHRWETAEKNPPFKGARKIAVQAISYDRSGLILPVKMD